MTPRQRRTRAQREAAQAAERAQWEKEKRVRQENTEAAARLLIDRLSADDLDLFLKLTDPSWWFGDVVEAVGKLRGG